MDKEEFVSGRGPIHPKTTLGKSICIVYALIGIPLTLITIANLGKFLAATLYILFSKLKISSWFNNCRRTRDHRKQRIGLKHSESASEESGISFVLILILFLLYLFIGGCCFSVWKDQNLFLSFYNAFVTVFTISLGNIIPENYAFLFVIILYLIFGLILLSLVFGMTAVLVRKIHYGGETPKSSQECPVWFGGKRVPMGDVATYIGKYCGLTDPEIWQLLRDLDEIVANTIADKEGRPVSEVGLDFGDRSILYTIAQDSFPYMDDKTSLSPSVAPYAL